MDSGSKRQLLCQGNPWWWFWRWPEGKVQQRAVQRKHWNCVKSWHPLNQIWTISSSPSDEKISTHPNRRGKKNVSHHSTLRHITVSLDFQLPRGIGQIQVETIWHIATTASCHLPALHNLEKWILKFKDISLPPYQDSRNHQTKIAIGLSMGSLVAFTFRWHLGTAITFSTVTQSSKIPYSPKSENTVTTIAHSSRKITQRNCYPWPFLDDPTINNGKPPS